MTAKEKEIFDVLTTGDGAFSEKQAEWFMSELPKTAGNPLEFAKLYVIARLHGPKMETFVATEEEIEKRARTFLDKGVSDFLHSMNGGDK